MKHLKIFESEIILDKKDEALLSRIMKHGDSFRKILADLKSEQQIEVFAEHFNLLNYIKARPKEMTSLLLPSIESHQSFRNWIIENLKEFPESFSKNIGMYAGMKNLGF